MTITTKTQNCRSHESQTNSFNVQCLIVDTKRTQRGLMRLSSGIRKGNQIIINQFLY